MDSIQIWGNALSERQAHDLARHIEDGALIIYPTDTLYAIGCDALNVKAIERLCSVQGINPAKACLSIICSDISQAAEYARIDNRAFRLIKENTPGPFTFILKTLSSLPRAFKGRKEVGVRIPECEAPLQLVRSLGHPMLTATIHASDQDYTVNPELIAEAYAGKADIILIGEQGGTEPSTIVNLTGGEPVIEREGKGILV